MSDQQIDQLTNITNANLATGDEFIVRDASADGTDAETKAILVSELDLRWQPLDAQLTDIAALTPTDSNFIVGDGSNFVLEDASTARTSLGLVAGGAGDIWVEKAGDTMTGALTVDVSSTTALQVETGGNNALVVDTANGRLGLGTDAPSNEFHFKTTTGNTLGRFEWGSAATASEGGFLFYQGGFYMGAMEAFGTTATPYASAVMLTAARINDGTIKFRTNTASSYVIRAHIANTGEFGIATESPAARLHVVGITDDEQLIVQANSSQTLNIVEVQDSGGTDLVTIDGSGNLDVVSGAYELGGANINTGGTLSNIAYLDQNNTFTVGQLVDGSADEVQLTVQKAVGQTAHVFVAENNAAQDRVWIDKDLRLTIQPETFIHTSGTQKAVTFSATFSTQSGVGSAICAGVDGSTAVNTLVDSPSAEGIGVRAVALTTNTAAGLTLKSLYGAQFRAYGSGSSVAGTLTNVYCMSSDLWGLLGTATGTITNLYGFHLATPTVAGTGTVTNIYGLYLNNISGAATNNYAIFTNAGLNQLGDQLSVVGSADRVQTIIKANSTQLTNIVEVQNSGGTSLFQVLGDGRIEQPAATVVSPATNYRRIYSRATYSTATPVTSYGAWLEYTFNYSSGSGGSHNGAFYKTNYKGTANISTFRGQYANGTYEANGNVSNWYNISSEFTTNASGTITNWYGFAVEWNYTAGTIANAYGLYIPDLSDATTNYAIYTNAGDIRLMEAATDKMGLWGATPVVQPAAANQAALTNSTGGSRDGTLAAVSGSGDDANINNNFTDIHELLDEIRTALVNTGIIKGSA